MDLAGFSRAKNRMVKTLRKRRPGTSGGRHRSRYVVACDDVSALVFKRTQVRVEVDVQLLHFVAA